MKISNLVEQARLAARLSRERPVEIGLFGGDEARAAYDTFTKRHRHLPFLRNKTFGIALLRVPQVGKDPFSDSQFRALRRRRARALASGYTFAAFEPKEYVDRILAINCSAPERQGKPVSPAYTDPAAVARYCAVRRPFFGVFDSGNLLRAYCHAPTLGEVTLLARFFGEYDRLQDGIMYLLLSGVVSELSVTRAASGNPLWIMYDTYIGGGSGMRTFKERCGFRPYRVKWIWRDGTAS